jgi:hypothetical protein
MSENLKQISAIFNDCLEVIRNQQYEGLDKEALKWLKGTRYELMRQIEAEYWSLFRSVNTPSALPAWALDSTIPLKIFTRKHQAYLRPYHVAIVRNLSALLDSCGFQSRVSYVPSDIRGDSYICYILFPDRLTDRTSPIPSTLEVDDDFSRDMGGGFARLLTGTESASRRRFDS